MFKLTPNEIKEMEKAIDEFEEDSRKHESITEGGTLVRDLDINGKPCRICFIISYVDDGEDD